MKQASYIVIRGRKDIDSFMKAADLFNGKNLGAIEELTIKYDENTKLSLKRAAKGIEHIKKAFEQCGEIVSFVHLKEIRISNTITVNDSIKPYYDPLAREISNGYKAFIFKQFIELTTGFKCETDENFYIKEIV